jgi:hypothetical protein
VHPPAGHDLEVRPHAVALVCRPVPGEERMVAIFADGMRRT